MGRSEPRGCGHNRRAAALQVFDWMACLAVVERVVGLSVDLAAEHVVLDFGDGQPVSLSGVQAPSVAVVGIASVYGTEAMLTHPGMVSLRG